MITELCMNTGWGFQEVMQMPMKSFGMFVGHSRKIAEDKFSRLLMELTDIHSISLAGLQHYEALKSHYQGRLLSKEQQKKRANPRLFDTNVKEQADQAVAIVASALRVKKRRMGM